MAPIHQNILSLFYLFLIFQRITMNSMRKKPFITPAMLQQKIAQRAQPSKCYSPMQQFTNYTLDEIEPLPITCRNSESKQFPQTLTPPLISQSKKQDFQNHSFLQYQTQQQSLSNIKANYQSFQTVAEPSKPYSSIYNPNKSKNAYGIDQKKKSITPKQSAKKVVNENKKSQGNSQLCTPSKPKQEAREIVLTQIDMNQMNPPQEHRTTETEDTDLYYQIIKQRTYQKESSKNSCHQHPNKKAKYYMKTDTQDTTLICSYCAIQRAYEQKQIYCLLTNQEIYQKQKEPDSEEQEWCLVNQLSQLNKSKNQNKIKEIKNFLYATYETYKKGNQLKEELNGTNFINQLNQEITKICTQSLQNILEQNEEEQIVDQLNILLDDLKCMRKDIVSNMGNIVDTMQFTPFVAILQKYYQKLVLFDQTILDCEEYFNKNREEIQHKIIEGEVTIQKVLKSLIKGSSKDKQVYISFENKDSFQKHQRNNQADSEDVQDSDSMVLRSSETQQFLEFLQQKKSETELEGKFQDPLQAVQNFKKIGFQCEDEQKQMEKISSAKNIGKQIRERNLLLSPNFNDNEL